MADFPSLPLWTDAYLADTTDLSAEEHGAYLLLLMAAWRAPSCSLPDDDDRLARMARVGIKRWRKIRPVMERFFTVDERGWTQKRLLEEHERVKQSRDQKRDAANKRWRPRGAHGEEVKSFPADANGNDTSRSPQDQAGIDKLLKNNDREYAYASRPDDAAEMQGICNPYPYPEEEKKNPPSEGKKKPPDREPTSRAELEAILDPEHAKAVVDHRQRLRKPLTAHAARLLAGKFAKCPDPNAAADLMIERGWQGIEPEWVERRQEAAGRPGSQPAPPSGPISDENAQRLYERCIVEGKEWPPGAGPGPGQPGCRLTAAWEQKFLEARRAA